MVSVSETFRQLRDRNQCALIPFITAGDPDLETTVKALHMLDRSGADLIELGVPYSDPLADGPVIQAAATRALQRGTTLAQVLAVVKKVSPSLQAPIILFTYYNPILNWGIDRFFADIAAAGARGLVVPDMPLEEVHQLQAAADAAGIEIILLVAPTTPEERLRAIATQSQGFIYLVSVTGVTGARTNLQQQVQARLHQLRQVTQKPIGVGFGVSQPEQARTLSQWGADGVIIGSAFVKRLSEGAAEAGVQAIGQFCQQLKAALANQ
ncbi:Tryptophan synthase alpha chain [Halomicronema hongdechloris C2206]|uniref:Tryptophan synthase alpha chain n=1 Tax=Halomicronema hongdechloris C2206 TaxID=1641165 RepID=A0A1V8NLZ0_9CYAN|nr:tryptophan synthase subunit alpha [Halomicronema hongdechloris]ASC72048.1 Tryptophan synthase alpha chain [Halomicronema hongdechloris C2206]